MWSSSSSSTQPGLTSSLSLPETMAAMWIILLTALIGVAFGFRPLPAFRTSAVLHPIATRRAASFSPSMATKPFINRRDLQFVASGVVSVVARKSLYKVSKVGRASIIEVVAMKIWEVLTDPMQLLSFMYFTGMAIMVMQGLAGKFQTFLRRKSDTKETTLVTADIAQQVYECDNCHMQMRPARGRAQSILKSRLFKCSSCGADGSSFFDIDNLDDPRAVKRLERLKAAEAAEQARYDIPDGEEEEEDNDDDDKNSDEDDE